MEYDYINQLFNKDEYEDIFHDFNFNLLDSVDFKEDAVREEIIFPILKQLGYTASSSNKIIRSKALKHPFYYFGTKKYNVNIIPDYTFQIDNKNCWVLDAKRPNESITEGKNVFQAYSYAMHPEIQSDLYCLCNGKELAIFNVKEHTPILNFSIENLKENWEQLRKHLSPEFVKKPHLKDFSLDLGLFLMKISDLDTLREPVEMLVKDINDIAMLEEDVYSINDIFGIQGLEGKRFMATFDFNKSVYNSLLEILPNDIKNEISQHLKHLPFRFNRIDAKRSPVKITALIGRKIITNDNESYMPFEVVKFEKWEE